jgi:hypothetical protein
MKKIFINLIITFTFFSPIHAKILNIENKVQLEVPKNHFFIKFDKESASNAGALSGIEEFLDELDDLDLSFYLVGPKKLTDTVKLLLEGENFEDMKIFQGIMKKAEKKASSGLFEDPRKMIKWIVKEIKILMKKEKVDFYTYIITSNKKYTSIEDFEFTNFIENHLNKTNLELSKLTNEYRKNLTELAGDNKTILINEDTTAIIKKFKIENISGNQLALYTNFDIDYMNAVKLPYNLSIIIKDDKIHFIASECWLNCSKQEKRFDKMINPMSISFNDTESNNKSNSGNKNIVDQLNSLNELYKSGVLTKEEFEKAKKKILN